MKNPVFGCTALKSSEEEEGGANHAHIARQGVAQREKEGGDSLRWGCGLEGGE